MCLFSTLNFQLFQYHLFFRKKAYTIMPMTAINPQAKQYPYRQSSSGITLKFIPHTPTRKVNGIKMVETIVSRYMMSFILKSLLEI